MANARIREALAAGNNPKEKGPQVADGVLSITPDSPEAAEWRSRSLMDCAGTSSTFLDDDDDGPKPNELYGRFTWKIDHFSEISKRELRSNVFDVGTYKWYILVYPQGCDVCNHLSLFLCVADYDKLLPGWSHFAQFTIAVVNKDPKKSKYSDTLHRFCKKEHDWGWKKFMELSKVLDGFTVADTLVIKAQVQVILDKPSKPFRCLDPQYRRELVRVYLTNVESICRKFCDEKRARLAWVREDPKKFKDFWDGLSGEQRKPLIKEKGEVILKGIVKQFFNEKEVTSTLVMDALYSGCRQIEEFTRVWQQGKSAEGAPVVTVNADRNVFGFGCGLLEIIERASKEFIPLYKDDKVQDSLSLRSGQEGDDMRRDSVERDEKRLAELGRKTVEMYVISHVLCERLEVAYREAEALRRQELLIAEEEEAGRREENRLAAKAQADREKRAKKKERKKQKKELDRVKREAEEAERSRMEESRRIEVERRQVEATRRRVEEEEQQAAQQQRAQVQAAKKQPAKKPAASSSSSSAPPEAATSSSGNHIGGAAQQQQQQARSAKQAAAVPSARLPSAPADSPSTSKPAADSSSVSSTSGSSSDTTLDDDSASDSDAPAARSRAAGPSSTSGAGPSGGGAGGAQRKGGQLAAEARGMDELKSQVFILQERVKELESSLQGRDTEILALRAQLSELNASVELVDLVKQAKVSAKAKEANGPPHKPAPAPAPPAASEPAQAQPAAPRQAAPARTLAMLQQQQQQQQQESARAASHAATGPSQNGAAMQAPPPNVPRHMHPSSMPPSHSGDPNTPRPNAWGLPREPPAPVPSLAPAPAPAAVQHVDPPPSATRAPEVYAPTRDSPAAPPGPVNYSSVTRGRATPVGGGSFSSTIQPPFEQSSLAQASASRGPSPALGGPPLVSAARLGPSAVGPALMPHIRPIVTHPLPHQQQQHQPLHASPSHPSPQHAAAAQQPATAPQQQQPQQQPSPLQPPTPQQHSQPSSPGSGGPPPPSPGPASSASSSDLPMRAPLAMLLERHNSAPGPNTSQAPGPPPPGPRPATAEKEPPPSTPKATTLGPPSASAVPFIPAASAPPPFINPPQTSAAASANGGMPPPPPLHPPTLPDSFRGTSGPSASANSGQQGSVHSLSMRPGGQGAASTSGGRNGAEEGAGPPRLPNHNDGPFGGGFVPQPQPPRGPPQRLGFGSMQAKRALVLSKGAHPDGGGQRPHAAAQSENPGLDDFQHMAIITDLLTD